jgi:hypothetical protein
VEDLHLYLKSAQSEMVCCGAPFASPQLRLADLGNPITPPSSEKDGGRHWD